ncbi:hypothetical protein [Paramagnetospirillum kuznetsovii]|nr:hypothetical protein [Paramagnetospirillum kuznetsovii]
MPGIGGANGTADGRLPQNLDALGKSYANLNGYGSVGSYHPAMEDFMFDIPLTGLKLAAPKLLSGALLGLPITIVIGPGLGLVVVGVLGAACVGGYISAVNSLPHAKSGFSVATPPI